MAAIELVITEVDEILLGDRLALEEFAAWWVGQRPLRLAYCSARSCGSLAALIESARLPEADALIAGAGTELQCPTAAAPIRRWQDRWWPHWDAARVQETLAGVRELRLRSPESQAEFKTSYAVDHVTPELLCGIREALVAARVQADLLCPSSRIVEVLPRGANKGAAGMFLAREWGIPREAIVVAGQSAADASLYVHGCRGVLVANADQELKTLIGCTAYLSPWPHAAGLLDGLRYWLGESAPDPGAAAPAVSHGWR